MTTPHTSGAADLPEALDAIADSQYLAGVAAGWNAAQASDPNAALRKIHESRAGYLKPLRDAQLAALAAGQAVAPAEAMEVDNYPSLPKSTGDVVDWGIGSSSREVDWSDDAPPAGGKSLYTADQMRAYVDADRATRPAPPAMDGARLDNCTDPYNCKRCKSHPNHRAGLEHAGIPAARAAQKEGE